jgi:nucleoid-associated protein YgaU
MDKDTTPFQTTEPEPDDGWYEDEPNRHGKVLWGRIIALIVALLVAFLVGRATAGGGSSISPAAYAKVKRDLAIARAKATRTNQTPLAGQATPTPSPSPDASETTAAAGGTTYTVKSGDTLRGIAQKFYGDASLTDLIAQANNITDPTLVHEGTELTIPPKP